MSNLRKGFTNYLIRIHETHFYVHLSEFWLTVST